MFQFRLLPTTNKPTRITKDTISAIDHIIINSIINSEFKIAILAGDISDYFPIIYAIELKVKRNISKTQFLYKRIINENLIKAFKRILHEVSWEVIRNIEDAIESYRKFTTMLTSIYDNFPLKVGLKYGIIKT